MNETLWLMTGILFGWLFSLITKTETQRAMIVNIIVSTIGAFLGGFIFNVLWGSIEDVNLWSVPIALASAITFVWILKIVRIGFSK